MASTLSLSYDWATLPLEVVKIILDHYDKAQVDYWTTLRPIDEDDIPLPSLANRHEYFTALYNIAARKATIKHFTLAPHPDRQRHEQHFLAMSIPKPIKREARRLHILDTGSRAGWLVKNPLSKIYQPKPSKPTTSNLRHPFATGSRWRQLD